MMHGHTNTKFSEKSVSNQSPAISRLWNGELLSKVIPFTTLYRLNGR